MHPLFGHHPAHLVRADSNALLGHHLANLIRANALLWHHATHLIGAGANALLGHHATHLTGADTLLRYHLADFVFAGANALLGHHLANLVGSHALLGHHGANSVRARLYPLLRHHLADLIALLFNDSLTLVAHAFHLLFADLLDPCLLGNGAWRALFFDLGNGSGLVAAFARTRIAYPATRLANASRDHRTGNLTGLRVPAAAADFYALCVVNWLAHRSADVAVASLPHWLAHRVGNLLRAGFLNGLAHRVGLLASLVNWLAHRVRNLLRAGLVDGLAHRAANLTGAGLGDRLADGVGLLARLVDRFTNRVGDFLRAGLPDWLADRAMDLTGLGLVHGLHHRVGNLFRDRFPHWLADRVIDSARTALPHRLADGVFDVLKRSLDLITDAVNLLLLNNFFTNCLVACELLLLVHDILDEAIAARFRFGYGRLTGGYLTTRTLRTCACETDRSQFGGAVFVAGSATVGGVGWMDRRRNTGKCQQTTKPLTYHVCCLSRGRLLKKGNETLGGKK